MQGFRERRVNKRYRVQVEVQVEVKSIGSQRPYTFRTSNISKGGVFVICDAPNPFSKQSILEVSMILKLDQFEVSIEFMGKVAHMQDKNGFGLKISQIDPEAHKKLEEFLELYLQENPDALITPPYHANG